MKLGGCTTTGSGNQPEWQIMHPDFRYEMIAVTKQLCPPGRWFLRRRRMGWRLEPQAGCKIIQ
jgi:hypothetical protein